MFKMLSSIRGSEDTVIVHQEGQVEGEPDQGPEHGLAHQQHEVPHIVRQVVGIFQKRGHQAAFVKKTREFLEVDEEARDDVEDVD